MRTCATLEEVTSYDKTSLAAKSFSFFTSAMNQFFMGTFYFLVKEVTVDIFTNFGSAIRDVSVDTF